MRQGPFAGAAALSLVVALGTGPVPLAQAAEPVTVLSEDFEDGDFTPLTQNGGPTLSVVDADGDKALLVRGRANDYNGVKTPASLLQPGGFLVIRKKDAWP